MGSPVKAEYEFLQVLDIRDAERFERASAKLIGAPVQLLIPEGRVTAPMDDGPLLSWEEASVALLADDADFCTLPDKNISVSPIRIEGRMVAVIAAGIPGNGFSGGEHYKDFLIALAQIASSLAGASFSNQLLYHQAEEGMQQKVRELSYLFEISKSLHDNVEFEEASNRFLGKVADFAGASCGIIMIMDHETQTIQNLASIGCSPMIKGIRLSPGEDLSGRVIDTGITDYIADINNCDLPARDDFRFSLGKTVSLLSLPLQIENRNLGVLHLGYNQFHQPSAEIIDLLDMVAQDAAVFIEHGRLFKEVSRLAITDGLTRLNNHRFMQQRMDEELERAKRYQRPFSVLMIDIDRFKMYNDRFGHLAGDVLLKSLSRLLESNTRSMDVLARYGGEEFCIVLPETSSAEAEMVAERIRREVGETLHYHNPDDSSEGKVTVSIGVSTFPRDGASKTALLAAADKALYRAKQSGRNRVVLFARASKDLVEGFADAFSGMESDALDASGSNFLSRFKVSMIILLALLNLLVQFILRQNYNDLSTTPFIYMHMVMELYSSLVGIIIFYVSFSAARRTGDNRLSLLGKAFLIMALLTILHLLTFPGGVNWLTDSDSGSTIAIWLASRTLGAILLAVATFMPHKRSHQAPNESLGHEILWPILVALVLYLGADRLSSMYGFKYEIGQSTGLLSMTVESGIAFLYLVAATGFIRIFHKGGNRLILMFIIGMFAMALADGSVLMLKGTHNMLAHAYKALAYLVMLAGLWLVERNGGMEKDTGL